MGLADAINPPPCSQNEWMKHTIFQLTPRDRRIDLYIQCLYFSEDVQRIGIYLASLETLMGSGSVTTWRGMEMAVRAVNAIVCSPIHIQHRMIIQKKTQLLVSSWGLGERVDRNLDNH